MPGARMEAGVLVLDVVVLVVLEVPLSPEVGVTPGVP
jgi:hypothetical protein